MIPTFINPAIANRPPRSALDLSEREIAYDHDTEALDRFDEPPPPKVDAARANRDAGRAEHEPAATHTALHESSGMEGAAMEASTPQWRAFKVALLILCINLATSALIAVVVFKPSLALLGFFVEFCVMSLTGLPMLLATVSEATEKH